MIVYPQTPPRVLDAVDMLTQWVTRMVKKLLLLTNIIVWTFFAVEFVKMANAKLSADRH